MEAVIPNLHVGGDSPAGTAIRPACRRAETSNLRALSPPIQAKSIGMLAGTAPALRHRGVEPSTTYEPGRPARRGCPRLPRQYDVRRLSVAFEARPPFRVARENARQNLIATSRPSFVSRAIPTMHRGPETPFGKAWERVPLLALGSSCEPGPFDGDSHQGPLSATWRDDSRQQHHVRLALAKCGKDESAVRRPRQAPRDESRPPAKIGELAKRAVGVDTAQMLDVPLSTSGSASHLPSGEITGWIISQIGTRLAGMRASARAGPSSGLAVRISQSARPDPASNSTNQYKANPSRLIAGRVAVSVRTSTGCPPSIATFETAARRGSSE